MTDAKNPSWRCRLPGAIDPPNKEGLSYWERSWADGGIDGFSAHSAFIEQTKWSYLVQDLAGREGTALEVGCGSGHMASLMAANGFQAVLLDYSPAAVRCARSSWRGLPRRERKSFVIGDALSLPFPESSMNAVLSCGLLEHFENPLAPVREMARVLKPGGLLYADICPRKFSLIGAVDFLYPRQDGWYEARLNKRDIRKMIATAGLNMVRLFAAGVLPPRNIPGRGRFHLIERTQRLLIDRWGAFWKSMDGTRLAEVFGFYYYVTAEKPLDQCSLAAQMPPSEDDWSQSLCG